MLGIRMAKRFHEIRDPIHTFIRLDSDEREVLDSRPLQRLRHIHQLAMSHLVYPGATHKRFEHSLGVMELAGRVFDVITRQENIRDGSVKPIMPSQDELTYWRRVLRMAALCHDVGHLPFSHAAERDLLPPSWNHERLTVQLVRSEELDAIWRKMTPPLRWLDIIKLAIGAEKCEGFVKDGALPEDAAAFTDWQTILAEVIVGEAFGVDRMDYLLRDSYHAGVAYGRFDHYRLVDTLRILPKEYEESQETALGVEEGGLRSAEALLLARYFMYTQVYFHPINRIYEVHLKDFLADWLKDQSKNGKFPTDIDEHLAITDNEIMAAILRAAREKQYPGYEPARRIVEHDHYRCIYQSNPVDAKVNPAAVEAVFNAICSRLGPENVRRDDCTLKGQNLNFPVLTGDDRVVSSVAVSDVLERIPMVAFDCVFVEPGLRKRAEEWLKVHRTETIQPTDREVTDGST